jgi:hypothetical protein
MYGSLAVPSWSEPFLGIQLWGVVYTMRMARVNITMPDELYRQAKAAKLNVSQLAQGAIAGEVTRRAKIAELAAYLAELEVELGPISHGERADAKIWADGIFGRSDGRQSP